jgi:hypothetical protein
MPKALIEKRYVHLVRPTHSATRCLGSADLCLHHDWSNHFLQRWKSKWNLNEEESGLFYCILFENIIWILFENIIYLILFENFS